MILFHCSLQSLYKKLEHPMCLSLILPSFFFDQTLGFHTANFQILNPWLSLDYVIKEMITLNKLLITGEFLFKLYIFILCIINERQEHKTGTLLHKNNICYILTVSRSPGPTSTIFSVLLSFVDKVW